MLSAVWNCDMAKDDKLNRRVEAVLPIQEQGL